MEEPEAILEIPSAEKPKMRKFALETDGTKVNIKENELTVLEIKEICRMLLKELGG